MTGGFGWRARIGQLYPAGGLADSEPQTMAPDGVLFVTTRLGFNRVGLEHSRGLVRDLEGHARLLADAAMAHLFQLHLGERVPKARTLRRV